MVITADTLYLLDDGLAREMPKMRPVGIHPPRRVVLGYLGHSMNRVEAFRHPSKYEVWDVCGTLFRIHPSYCSELLSFRGKMFRRVDVCPCEKIHWALPISPYMREEPVA